MANFCLPKELTQKFLRALKDNTLNVDALAEMSSEERRAAFAHVVGEGDAKSVNALFESKLLLKNQKLGMVTWAKEVAGLKDPVRRDIIATIERLDTVLDPASEKAFLEDLAAKRLGVEVTFEEAKRISDLSSAVKQLAETKVTEDGRLAWGNSMLDLNDYVEGLIPTTRSLAANVLNVPKSVMSTLDFSAAFRQGWGMASRSNFWKSLIPMFKYAFSEGSFRHMQADIISRPTYPLMKASGLRVSALANKLSQREEAYMTTLLDKFPFYRGAERAYVGFLTKLRADEFDRMIARAKLGGEHIGNGSKASKEIANVVNDFTGSGNIGAGDKYGNAVPLLNATFFSPRKISATVNMFNPKRYLDPSVSKVARQEALRNLVGSVALSAAVLSLAAAAGATVELNPTSTDFGKFKFGKTRYDVTGGNGTYAVLLARMITNKSKSSTSGKTTTLGKGYKATTRADLAVKFARNKLAPIPSLAADWLYGSDAVGNPFNLQTEVLNRLYPLVIQDVVSIGQNDPANLFGSIIAAELGVGVQSY